MNESLFSTDFNLIPTWVAVALVAVVTLFTLYVGVALAAVLTARNPDQQEIRYKVFRALLDVFSRWAK